MAVEKVAVAVLFVGDREGLKTWEKVVPWVFLGSSETAMEKVLERFRFQNGAVSRCQNGASFGGCQV